MADIVKVLRDQQIHHEDWLREMCLQAASEIERLRNGLELIYEHAWGYAHATRPVNNGAVWSQSDTAAYEMISLARRTLNGQHQLPTKTELRGAHDAAPIGQMTTEILERYRKENEELHMVIHKLESQRKTLQENTMWLISKFRENEDIGNV